MHLTINSLLSSIIFFNYLWKLSYKNYFLIYNIQELQNHMVEKNSNSDFDTLVSNTAV